MGFEVIDHTADTGICVWAQDLPTLFSESVRGMFHQITDLEKVNPIHSRMITIKGMDETDLLINTLRELFYRFTMDGLLVKTLFIESLADLTMKGRIRYDDYDPEAHEIQTEIKAVTYAGGDIRKTTGGYTVTIIFDI